MLIKESWKTLLGGGVGGFPLLFMQKTTSKAHSRMKIKMSSPGFRVKDSRKWLEKALWSPEVLLSWTSQWLGLRAHGGAVFVSGRLKALNLLKE